MLWVWGLGGAFLFAGPRWVRCWVGCRETGGFRLDCTIDFFVCLVVGAIAAEAFTPSLLTKVGLAHQNGVCTLIGALANPVIPEITKRAPKLAERILKALPGGDK